MKALILIDIQNDFMPGGALGAKDGDAILPAIHTLLQCKFDLRIATKDWHPANHLSFAKNHNLPVGSHINLQGLDQILWPVHCIQGSKGAEFAPGWDYTLIDLQILKGTNREIDSYSAFFDNGHRKSTGLEDILKLNDIDTVYIAGLVTDYCVKYSVLDAISLGFKVYVVTDGCKGANLQPEDSENALNEMQRAGAILTTSNQVQQELNETSSSK